MSRRTKPAAGPKTSPLHVTGTRSTIGSRRRVWRIVVPLLLAATVIIVIAIKPNRDPASSATEAAPIASHGPATRSAGIPRLVDVGADKCIPCKAMAPILVELRAEYAGRLQVDFIDVWKNPGAGDPYHAYAIPTQIFFDGNGRELTRHQGFISKEDILATWKRFGFEFDASGGSAPRS